MTFTKLPDEFNELETVVNLSDAAYRLYVAGFVHANKRLSDGYLPTGALRMIVPRLKPSAVKQLVGSGLWRPTSGGYQIVEFLEEDGGHQFSRSKVEQLRIERAKAGKRGADTRWADRTMAIAMANPSQLPSLTAGKPMPRTHPPRPTSRRDTSSFLAEDARLPGMRHISGAVAAVVGGS